MPAINIPQNPRLSASSLHSYHSSSPSSVCSSCSCSSCEDSLPLNTPWSTAPNSPPTSSASTTARRRRGSIPIVNMQPTPHSRSVSVDARGPSAHAYHSSHAVVTPGVTSSSRRHQHEYRQNTSSSRRSSSHHRSGSSSSYHHAPKYSSSHSSSSKISSGCTRFPKKLVSKSAAKQLHYPYITEAEHGGITIPQVLNQAQIDELVQLTRDIRKHRHEGKKEKSVTFFEKTIVHEVPPAPLPPPSEFGESRREPVVLVPASSRPEYRRLGKQTYYNYAPPKFEPLSPPGPSTPKPLMARESEFPIGRRNIDSELDSRTGSKSSRSHRREVVVVRD